MTIPLSLSEAVTEMFRFRAKFSSILRCHCENIIPLSLPKMAMIIPHVKNDSDFNKAFVVVLNYCINVFFYNNVCKLQSQNEGLELCIH